MGKPNNASGQGRLPQRMNFERKRHKLPLSLRFSAAKGRWSIVQDLQGMPNGSLSRRLP
ncbi:hypothetical protein GCM10007362_41380 [Saccharibacillus endophyticus]|uniref:Uncharacterized protein n=1 Tax=Saccharibacillus endophyticus TaxID=2060666 RepID=A0ABQ2A2M2_9BACL|nr:hypothetical protein GCM10007362_41380 [Saccharibacillus endophyticus]